jgi:hypothetical protein
MSTIVFGLWTAAAVLTLIAWGAWRGDLRPGMLLVMIGMV